MNEKTLLRCKVNGSEIEKEIDSAMTLLTFLREELGLTGTKDGCGEGECGACTVLVDMKSVNSCLTPAIAVEGKEVLTIEGMADDGVLSALQQSFIDHGAIQCGFCSPGMLMSAKALLIRGDYADDEAIRRGISGNLCRCTGYQAIVNAIKAVANGEYGEQI